ncbi:hypothetical protein SPBR_02813 [Sporothrix brasiliensis 5110]|uniref:Thymidylate kinase n=1 Tax=Sporothrix brasiliensis 5110 TaxID=1398154 RepID=A0A0C2F0M6_9PEZI|nr:uncharacterized protein SPBR_02813 [Sporothrix brasiliensis 5110]KIH92364.1 hypothetical protein SPBR_02813 [Sporothrix brasiliensis 5110]
MATIARQPFAPLDGARLQALTSTKNRQNAAQSLASKRKAPTWTEAEDVENVDPQLSAKRSKGADGSAPAAGSILKKPAFTLTKANMNVSSVANIFDVKSSSLSSSPRTMLKPRGPSAKSAAMKISTSPIRMSTSPIGSSLSSSLSGRTPRASRRGGLLTSKRRAASNLSRSSPTATGAANFGSAAPFSLDAALKGTFSSFDTRLASSALVPPSLSPLDDASGMSTSWFFDIHEDTPEQEMTNLLQHSTCVLDISSDEESELKARRERAEGRDKENIPPPNDVSQTSAARAEATSATANTDEMSVDKARNPLSQLNAADYYADGCDEASVVLVASDEPEGEEQQQQQQLAQSIDAVAAATTTAAVEASAETVSEVVEAATAKATESEAVVLEETTNVEDIMTNRENPACEAALLEPIDGTGESFQLWESGSQKDGDL